MRIEQEILREAKRLIIRHEEHGRLIAEENQRRCKRSTAPQLLSPVESDAPWAVDPGFNPYHARRHSQGIAHSIRQKIVGRTYVPRPPLLKEIAKPGGGERTISRFQVADSAISRMLFESLLKKNAPIFSNRAYAYRKDISAQDAIHYVSSEFHSKNRMFIAEYDFTKYFQNVDHDNIRRILKERFLVADAEESIIESFLTVKGAYSDAYTNDPLHPNTKGIPQGTSISLFLANVAAWDLDRQLERVGVGFVRYADDTLIWSPHYGRICDALEQLHDTTTSMGVEVNLEKSDGVRLLVPDGAPAEIEATNRIDYVGYSLSLDTVAIKSNAVKRIKAHISQILYWTLIHEPERCNQALHRLHGSNDRDYVSAVVRIRRYLYGDLSERALRGYQRRAIPLRRFRGVMSAYPLANDPVQLRSLDKWLELQLYLALRKRGKLLSANYQIGVLPEPHGRPLHELRELRLVSSTGEYVDVTIPSFRRIANLLNRAAIRHGPSAIGRSDRYQLYS